MFIMWILYRIHIVVDRDITMKGLKGATSWQNRVLMMHRILQC